jgi:hypothetical protein
MKQTKPKHVPPETPTLEEKKAIKEKDEVIGEEELMKALGNARVRHKHQ